MSCPICCELFFNAFSGKCNHAVCGFCWKQLIATFDKQDLVYEDDNVNCAGEEEDQTKCPICNQKSEFLPDYSLREVVQEHSPSKYRHLQKLWDNNFDARTLCQRFGILETSCSPSLDDQGLLEFIRLICRAISHGNEDDLLSLESYFYIDSPYSFTFTQQRENSLSTFPKMRIVVKTGIFAIHSDDRPLRRTADLIVSEEDIQRRPAAQRKSKRKRQ